MALVKGVVHPGSVIAAIAHEKLDRVSNLIKQGLDLGGVIDVGQNGSDDPAAYRGRADVQRSAACWCRASPLARAAQLQPGTVDQQVDAGGMGLRRQLEALSPPAEGREIAALALAGSGTGRSRPSSRRTEPISPSVWRSARRNTARNVRAVVIARLE
jgi:hypothetical protein